ncbi:MAG: FtsK/SpoIIIE domain-containing protein [Sulfurimonas sp.]|nr:FtsK/SpoIIIE domain-containing protein [Sulfurimonas sp.]
MLEMLLENGADINSSCQPLFQAYIENNKSIIDLLLDKNALIEYSRVTEQAMKNGLIKTIQNENIEFMKILIEKGTLVDNEGSKTIEPYLTKALKNEDMDLSRLLIQAGANNANISLDNILSAYQKGDRNLLDLYIEVSKDKFNKKDLNDKVMDAIDLNNLEMVKCFIEFGADVNHTFVQRNNNEWKVLSIVEHKLGGEILKLDNGKCVVNTFGSRLDSNTLLLDNGDKVRPGTIIKILKTEPTNIKKYKLPMITPSEDGVQVVASWLTTSPLIKALQSSNLEIAAYLLQIGADTKLAVNQEISLAELSIQDGHSGTYHLKLKTGQVDKFSYELVYESGNENSVQSFLSKPDNLKKKLGLSSEMLCFIDEKADDIVVKVYNDSKESQLLNKLLIDGKKPKFFDMKEGNHTSYFYFEKIPGVTIDIWNHQKQLIEDILKIPIEIEKYDSAHELYDSDFCAHELIIIKESSISSMPGNLGIKGQFLKQAKGQWIFENIEQDDYEKWNEKLSQIQDYLGEISIIVSYDSSKGHLHLQESIDGRLPRILKIEEDGNYPELIHIETKHNTKRSLYYSEVDGLDNLTKWKRKTKEIIKKLGSNVFIKEFHNRDKTIPVEADHMILIQEVDYIPEPKELSGLDILSKQRKEKLYWGVGAEGDYYTSISDATHMLVMGESGSGKSNFMNGLILSLLNSLESIEHIYMVDLKGGVELHEYADFAPQKVAMISSTQKLLDLLLRIKLEMEARLKYMKENRLKKITDNPIFLIIDEYADIQQMDDHTSEERQIKNEVLSLLKDLIRKARATNIKIWAMLQEASDENMDKGFKNQLKSRVLLKTTEESTARFAIPDNYLDELQLDVTRLPTGRILFVDASDDRAKGVELQFPLVDAPEIHPNDKKFYQLDLQQDISKDFSKTIVTYFEEVLEEFPDLKHVVETTTNSSEDRITKPIDAPKNSKQYESIQTSENIGEVVELSPTNEESDRDAMLFSTNKFDVNQILAVSDDTDENESNNQDIENQKKLNEEANQMAEQFKQENNL